MAVLPILEFPDPRLRTAAAPLDRVDRETRKILDDMFETMYGAPGVGLAANQVGILLRFAVMDCSEGHDSPIVMVNPEIVSGENLCDVDEGCLSVPGYQEKVRRYDRVILRAQDIDGKEFTLEADGLLAQCIQHEIDHLDGKLFIDQLSRLKRERIRKKLEKDHRRAG